MKLIPILLIGFLVLSSDLPAQFSNPLKLQDKPSSFGDLRLNNKVLTRSYDTESKLFQFKKRKTVTSYVGAGYSFVIFTARDMNEAYPVFDTRSGDFLSEINLFFGFAIAKAVTLEFEPSFLFANSSKSFVTSLNPAVNGDTLVGSINLGIFAIPLMVHARFFPFFKMSQSFARLFFVGGGVGAIWVREDYDNIYTNDPNIYYYTYGFTRTESTSQWAPVFRIMTGFTGTGGQFGFGGELRYNFVPLKSESNVPFKSKIAPNFNSVDITLRFYFSL